LSKKKQIIEFVETPKKQRLILPEKQDLLEPDFIRVEKNIAAFGFFTPSSKRVKNVPKVIKFTQQFEGNKVEAQVKISGNVEYGMPITSDQDKYLAFQKLIDRVKQEKGRVENPISFTTAELLSLLGTSKNGNRYKEVEEWLKVMNTTFIESEGAVWIAGKKRYASDSFVVFQRVRRTGQELEDGSLAEKNYVWLSDWYIENLNNYYLLPIDFETYKQLKNHVAKALIPLLQVWLYASREVGRFEKKYSEICQTLNITQYKHLSLIKQKFSPSLDELVSHQYLESWEIEKTADKKDFKIIFNHGFKFYSDRAKAKRLAKRKKNKTIELPHKLQIKPNEATLPFDDEKHIRSQRTNSDDEIKTQTTRLKSKNTQNSISNKQREILNHLFVDFGISIEKGTELVTNFFEEAKKQIEVYPFRNIQPKNKAGYLIDAIEKSYSLPEAYIEEIKIKAERKAKEDYEERMRLESEQFLAEQEKLISGCQFCNKNGQRVIKLPNSPNDKAFHLCSHNESIETQLENYSQ
jgi:hypothetical protein